MRQEKKETFQPKRLFDCNKCRFRDRPIVVVGSCQFNTQLLVNYIRCNKPAPTSTARCLADIPPPDTQAPDAWRLIFLNCHGLNGNDIAEMLQHEGAPYLHHDIIALFNLLRNDINLSLFIDLGVRGFFFEEDQPETLLKGICSMKFGEMWVARGILMEYINSNPKQAPPLDPATQQLTRREKDVLFQLACGATNEEIATRLFISHHTVKTHISHICKKLEVQNRLQAALWAAKYLA